MIRTYGRYVPQIHPSVFVHDSAEVIGRVKLMERVSVWPLCVLRGDEDSISIGPRCNIQDLTVIHTTAGSPTVLGKDVMVGHGVILHGCRVGDNALIGMGAVVMEAVVGTGAVVGAGAVVPAGMRIPPRSMVMGVPAKVVRKVTAKEARAFAKGRRGYLREMELHRRSSLVMSRSTRGQP